MRILNLYAGLGGNRLHWDGHEVTAVEDNPEILAAYHATYPHDFTRWRDAHDFLPEAWKEYDFIWSSPPCQSHSRMQLAGRNRTPRYIDAALWQEIIFLKTYCKDKLWCVENVQPYYDPLIPPTAKIGRHLFWTSFDISFIQDVPRPEGFINKQNQQAKQELLEWLGLPDPGNIYYDGNHDPTQVLRNCVHPQIGKGILDAAGL